MDDAAPTFQSRKPWLPLLISLLLFSGLSSLVLWQWRALESSSRASQEQLFALAVDGVELTLTPKEFALLAVLAEEPGRVVPRTELHARIWDPVWVGSGKSLDVHVATLRKKLPPQTLSIEAIRGVGYRLVLP